jgi:hypothetical protein
MSKNLLQITPKILLAGDDNVAPLNHDEDLECRARLIIIIGYTTQHINFLNSSRSRMKNVICFT